MGLRVEGLPGRNGRFQKPESAEINYAKRLPETGASGQHCCHGNVAQCAMISQFDGYSAPSKRGIVMVRCAVMLAFRKLRWRLRRSAVERRAGALR